MSVKKLFLLVPALAASLFAGAQNVSDLIISEVMPVPDSTSLVDGFGARNGWVEIFNTSQGTVNFGGCYLTDDRSDLRKSMISGLDRSTKLGPRQCVVFYASGDQSNGTFYTSFKLRRGTTLYLVSNDGRTLVDSLVIPSDVPAGKSLAKFANDNKAIVFDECKLSDPTPQAYNAGGKTESGARRLAREDPHGYILTLVSVSVVFCALLILWWLFAAMFQSANKKHRAALAGQDQKKAPAPKGDVNGEIAAAIAMALGSGSEDEVAAAIGMALDQWLSDTIHDTESFVVTIRRDGQSMWNNKALNFRNYQR